MRPGIAIIPVTIAPGSGRAAVLADAIPGDTFAVRYAPGAVPADSPHLSAFHLGGKEVFLTPETSPLILTIPGTYTFVPVGTGSTGVSVLVSDPFPVVMQATVPGYAPAAALQE